jgi:hypothetical protein
MLLDVKPHGSIGILNFIIGPHETHGAGRKNLISDVNAG